MGRRRFIAHHRATHRRFIETSEANAKAGAAAPSRGIAFSLQARALGVPNAAIKVVTANCTQWSS